MPQTLVLMVERAIKAMKRVQSVLARTASMATYVTVSFSTVEIRTRAEYYLLDFSSLLNFAI